MQSSLYFQREFLGSTKPYPFDADDVKRRARRLYAYDGGLSVA